MAAIVAGLVLLAGQAVWAADELVVMDLPTTGPLAASAQACYDALGGDGLDVWWLRQKEPRQRDRQPSVMLLSTDAPLPEGQIQALPDFVRAGGGLVFVAASDDSRLEANRALLEPLGLKLYGGPGKTAAVQVRGHEITDGVGELGMVLANLTFSSSGLQALATQEARPVAVAGTLGKGRFVALLDNLVSVMGQGEADGPQVRLLTQAVRWAMGQASTNNAITLPAVEPETPRVEALTGQALVDLGAQTDRWPEVRRTAEGIVDAAGLQRETFTYAKDKHTLTQGLAAAPAVVVIGSTRTYTEDEAEAFGQYVWHGGSALVLAYATPATVPNLQALNRMLAEVSMAVTFGRPGGITLATPGPLTTGIQGWRTAPPGVAIWALGEEQLVAVSRSTVFAAHEFGKGRVIVCDALTLVPDPAAKPPSNDSSPAFRELLLRALRWLVAGPEPQP